MLRLTRPRPAGTTCAGGDAPIRDAVVADINELADLSVTSLSNEDEPEDLLDDPGALEFCDAAAPNAAHSSRHGQRSDRRLGDDADIVGWRCPRGMVCEINLVVDPTLAGGYKTWPYRGDAD